MIKICSLRSKRMCNTAHSPAKIKNLLFKSSRVAIGSGLPLTPHSFHMKLNHGHKPAHMTLFQAEQYLLDPVLNACNPEFYRLYYVSGYVIKMGKLMVEYKPIKELANNR